MRKESSTSVRISWPRFDQQELIQGFKEKLRDLAEKLPLLLAVLFGSYAQGNYTTASDVDLLVVYEGEEREDAFAIVKKTVDIPLLEPHVYSEEEYERLKAKINRMTRNGVVLFARGRELVAKSWRVVL